MRKLIFFIVMFLGTAVAVRFEYKLLSPYRDAMMQLLLKYGE